MNVSIITAEFKLEVHGFSGVVQNGDYSGTAFRLMDRMWKIVKAKNLPNQGKNIWIYEGNTIFAGVELTAPAADSGLEHKQLHFTKHAYYKHIGPYSLIRQAGTNMNHELERQGLQPGSTYLEIYGHWTHDESKLETELLISLK